MRRHMLLGAACAGLLGACAAPDYRLAPSTPVARARLVNFNDPTLCVSGQRFALHADRGGYVTLPAGRPVHLIGHYAQMGGQCNPAVIFTPKAGQAYDVMNEARAERCYETVMLHDPAAQYGLRLEPSVSAPEICR